MWIIRHLLDVAIPAISACLASEDTVFKWLIKNQILSKDFNIQSWQRLFLIINIFFTTFVVYMKIEYHRNKEQQCRKEIAGLYNVVKEFAQSNFVSISGNNSFSFDLRIFVPEVSVLRTVRNLFKKEKDKWFVIRNIEQLPRKTSLNT